MGYYSEFGSEKVLFSHWESYSLTTMFCNITTVPIFGPVFSLSIAIGTLIMGGNCNSVIPFIAGYEFGTFLLPIAHDWVHLKKSKKYAFHYFFMVLEWLNIFASHRDHVSHHNHDHQFVYQNFSSSGIYSHYVDSIFNNIWNVIIKKAIIDEMEPWKPMLKFTILFTLSMFFVTIFILSLIR
jgi:hypothetical protein